MTTDAEDQGGDGEPRWSGRDEFIAEAMSAGYDRKDVRDALAEIAETRGFASGVRIETPGRGAGVRSMRLRGRRAWNEAQLVDANELWRYLEDDYGMARTRLASKDIPATAKAESEAKKELLRMMKAAPNGPSPPNDELFAELQGLLGKRALHLSKGAFARAKKAALKEFPQGAAAWSKAGRKKKSG